MLHKVSQDPFLKNLPVDITTLGHGAFPLTSDAILGNVWDFLSSIPHSLIDDSTSDIFSIPGDDGREAGVISGVPAQMVDM